MNPKYSHFTIALARRVLLSLLFALLLFAPRNYAQQFEAQNLNYDLTDTTKEKPVQYRRGISLQEGYQSYDEKYSGKNLVEEKRRLFPLQSTGVWTELNPKVPRVDYLGIQFVNKDTGWAVGDLGTLIKSTDGGNSWTVSETNTTTPILKVRSYNGQIVIASGFGGMILRSTDGGETFTQVTSGVTGDLWGLQMLNDTLGWACGNANSLTKTTDGGQTWQRIFTPGYTSDYWWIDFLIESYGFIAANGKVLRTIDGGLNWEIIQAGDSYPLFSIDVIDSLHIAAAGYGGTGYVAKNIYSSDAGNTWVIGGQLTYEAVNCIQYVNPDTGYVIMTNVIGKKTTNRGQEWTGITLGGEYEMQFFNDENLGYSAGTEIRIYQTENGYENWQRLIINDNFSDVFFVSEQKGFILSSSGLSAPSGLYKTTDSGLNWQKHPSGINGVDLLFLDSLTGFIGASNSIYKTTDGGNSWYPTQGTTGAGKIFFIDETTGWAIHSGTIYKTTDGGENWFEQLYDIVGSFNSIYFVDSLYGWVSNLAEWLYKTTDGGENWIQQTNSNIYSTTDVFFGDSLNGFAIKLLELYKTTNGGNGWFIQLNSQYVIRTFGWLTKSHGFIMGDGVYETIDSGNTWNEILELRNIGLRKFQAPKNYVGYSSGYLGLIYKYLDTTIVSVELTTFNAEIDDNIVTLNWSTATETNNRGFEILRFSQNDNSWKSIGFVPGFGTTTEPKLYSFTDEDVTTGIYRYRLKQIDFNGTFEYSNEINVEIDFTPKEYFLYQNYPNPFNPTTTIKYDIPNTSDVSLIIYDMLGRKVKELVNTKQQAGRYDIQFNATTLTSGVYFYRLQAGDFINSKKMILQK